MKIVLLEFIDEAKALMDSYGRDFFTQKDIKVICLHPKVHAYFKKEGIEALDTIPFLSNEAQHRIIRKSEDLTLKLMAELNLVDGFNIRQGYREVCIHHLRLYLNHFLWILEVLNGVREKYKIEQVYACVPSNRQSMYLRKGYIQKTERFLGLLAKDFCDKHQIQFVPTTISLNDSDLIEKAKVSFVRFLSTIIARLDYLMVRCSSHTHSHTIVVPGLSYRMDLLVKEIKKDQKNVKCYMIWEGQSTVKQEMYKAYLTLTNFQKRLKKENILETVIHLDLIKGMFAKNVQQQKVFNEQFDHLLQAISSQLKNDCSYEGVSLLEYLTEKINLGLRTEILDLQHATIVLSEIFKVIKPQLLMSMYSSSIYYMMGELANLEGFAALNISHGTHVPPNNPFEEIENYRLATSVISNTYKYVAVQTPWTNKFLDYYKDKRPRVLTGPLLYSIVTKNHREALRKEILGDNATAKIIVHAATQKGRHGMRFHITESLDEYVATLAEIVRAVNQLDNVYFVIRPHPICDLTEEEFRTLLPECPRMFVVSKGPFSKILSAADMVISYSSTCIEEAVQNNIPVILFDQWRRYNHFNISEVMEAQSLCLKPAYYVVKPQLLAQTIKKTFDLSANCLLDAKELIDYKYPTNYKMNFATFVKETLEGIPC